MGSKPPVNVPSASGDAFPQTRWSVILEAKGDDPAALAAFCQTYWFPLYSYARRKGKSVEDAQDLTQSFFERILSREFLGQARRERGRLRNFLLSSFNNFAAEMWRKERTQRRGHGQSMIAIDALSAEERFEIEPHEHVTAEVEYERAWSRELLGQALKKLESAYEVAGQKAIFLALRDHLTEGSVDRSYQAVASELGLSEASARFAAFKLRQRYRAILRELVGDTVSDPSEIEDELAHMHALFRS